MDSRLTSILKAKRWSRVHQTYTFFPRVIFHQTSGRDGGNDIEQGVWNRCIVPPWLARHQKKCDETLPDKMIKIRGIISDLAWKDLFTWRWRGRMHRCMDRNMLERSDAETGWSPIDTPFFTLHWNRREELNLSDWHACLRNDMTGGRLLRLIRTKDFLSCE